jgi:hypothetical protein
MKTKLSNLKNSEYLDTEFNKLVLNSDKPYSIHFYDFYGNKTKYLSIDSKKLNEIIKIIKL